MRILSGQGGNIENVAPAALPHHRYCIVAAIKHTVEICFKHPSKLVPQKLIYRLAKSADAGVVHENIYAAQAPFTLGEQHPDLVFTSHVADLAFSMAIFRKPFDGPVQVTLVAAADKNFRTVFKQSFGDGETDTLRAAGHDRNFIFQVHWLYPGS